MLDNIEDNLKDANNYMEHAVQHLASAKKWHEKTRTVLILLSIIVENVLHNDLHAGSDGSIIVWSIQSAGELNCGKSIIVLN